MKRTYQEMIPDRKDPHDKKIIKAHIVSYEYDTEDIKDECCVCGILVEESEERYKKRGNFCDNCSACKTSYQGQKREEKE